MHLLKEFLDIFMMVTIDAFYRSRWKAHGYYIARNIAEIKIISILLITPFFLRYPFLEQVLGFTLFLDPLSRMEIMNHFFHFSLICFPYKFSTLWMRCYFQEPILLNIFLRRYWILNYVLKCVYWVIVILLIFLWILLHAFLFFLFFPVLDVAVYFLIWLFWVHLKRPILKIEHFYLYFS